MTRSDSAASTGYCFLDKDPIIDLWRSAFVKSGMTYVEVSRISGITVGTLKKWDYGETRRPQHLTLAFAFRALGYTEHWTKD